MPTGLLKLTRQKDCALFAPPVLPVNPHQTSLFPANTSPTRSTVTLKRSSPSNSMRKTCVAGSHSMRTSWSCPSSMLLLVALAWMVLGGAPAKQSGLLWLWVPSRWRATWS